MEDAADAFEKELEGVTFAEAAVKIYANYTGEEYKGSVKDTLAEQIDHPVKWEKIIRSMIEDGADIFLEIGPGATLTGFMKKIDPSVQAFSVAAFEDIQAVLEGMKKC